MFLFITYQYIGTVKELQLDFCAQLTAPPIAYRAIWITGNPLENLGGFILSAWAPDPPSGYYLGDILR
jgi:hypothetical protein